MLKSEVRSALPKITVALACSMLVNGCAVDPRTGQPSFKETFDSDDPCANNARNIGIVAGTVLGAVVGHQMDKNSGKFIGAGLGGLVGGFIGADMDQRRCALAKVAKQYQLDMSFAMVDGEGRVIDDAALKNSRNADEVKKAAIGSVVSIRDQGGHFEANSDKLTSRAQEYFGAIAQSYNDDKIADGIANKKTRQDYLRQSAQRKLLLVGHTDDSGSSRLNADLSERRAKAVSRFLEGQGISKNSIYFQGAGESYPMADNSTEVGRAQNRRVEIIELASDTNLQKYLEARKPKYEYYREVEALPNKVATARQITKVSEASKPATTTRLPAHVDSTGSAAASRPKAAAIRESATNTAATKAAASRASSMPTIDFGGAPLVQSTAFANVGKVEQKKSWFSIISPAYANEPAVLRDCTQDRPRATGAVKALSDGKAYRTNEHFPGLYGKTWTDQVNGHRIVVNKVAVLKNDATLSRLPEFKVYANYNPSVKRNPAPTVSVTPEVNTYLGSNGVLYRMFLNGNAGMSCVDILFNSEGVTAATAGKLLYALDGKIYVADFKPTIVQ